jgi:hypothetical protein
MEVVGDRLSRIRLSGGGKTLVLESTGFTVTSDKTGLTITSPDVVTMTSSNPDETKSIENMKLHVRSTGTTVGFSKMTVTKK